MASLLTDGEIDILRLQSELFYAKLVSKITLNEKHDYEADDLHLQAHWIYANMKGLEKDLITDVQKLSYASALMKLTGANWFMIGHGS